MKKLNLIATLGIGLSLSSSFAQAQQTNNTDPVVGIQVLRDAFKVIEDELTQSGSQTQLTSKDYQEWNKQFRANLNDALDVYEQEFEAQIMLPLKPLSDQYNLLLQQKSIRSDQLTALKQGTLVQLQAVADTLHDAKAKIYHEMLVKVFPFLPLPKFTYLKSSESMYLFPFSDNLGRVTHRAQYNYEIGTLGASSIPALKTGVCSLVIGDPKTDGDSYEKPETWSVTTTWRNLGDTDGIDYYNYTYGSTTCEKDKKARTSLDVRTLFMHFVLPELEAACKTKTQVCYTLVQQDLARTYSYLENTIDQPFKINFTDRSASSYDYAYPGDVHVDSNSINLPIYSSVLNLQYLDSKLPFSN